MALTSVSAVKVYLGVTTTAQDAFLTQLLAAVEAAFLRLIDRQILAADYTVYECGRGTQIISLAEYPVITVTSVCLDNDAYWGTAPDAFPASSLLTPGVDYALVRDGIGGDAEVGRLYRINTVWPGRWMYKAGLLTPQLKPGAGNCKIVYRAGYETVPADIPLAIWQTVARIRAERKTGRPVLGERYEEYAYSNQADSDAQRAWLLGSAAQIVAKYRRITPRIDPLG